MDNLFKNARKAAGYSQQALADKIGCDRITIHRIENRKQTPSLATVEKIINAFRSKKVELSADAFLSQPVRVSTEVDAA